MSKPTVIIQARMGSTRLPGKAMLDLAGKPALWHVIERVKRAKVHQQIVVATTTARDDTQISVLALACGVNVFRWAGDPNDVLGRYALATMEWDADPIIRITGDCPVIDPVIIDAVVSHAANTSSDYGYASEAYPDGLDVEVFTREALMLAHKCATSASDREHVTPFIKRQCRELGSRFGTMRSVFVGPGSASTLADLSKFRWTLDEPEDYDLLKRIFDALYPVNPAFATPEILELLRRCPEWCEINGHIPRNDGYQRSVERERVEAIMKDVIRS